MHRTPPRVVIEVSPSRLELGVVRRASIAQARILRAAQADWGGTWPASLSTLAGTLRQWCAELGVVGAPVTLIYTAPTTAVGVFNCPASAGAAAAEQAALLSLAGLASHPIEDGPSGVRALGTDREAAPPSPNDPSPVRQAHTLAAAEHEATAAMLAEWLTGAGLRPDRFIPAGAIHAAHALSAISSNTTCAAALYIGEHECVLAAGDRSRLRFVRTLGLGLESLVDALVRSARVLTPTGEVVHTSRDGARELLAAHGVPDAGGGGAPAAHDAPPMLPLLTPVLQRLASEIKQSARFGLAEAERTGLSVAIIGPGACVRGLDVALGAQSGLAFVRAPSIDSLDAIAPASSADTGVISLWLAGDKTGLNLAPAAVRERHSFGRLRAAAWAGIGAAIAFVGYQGLDVRAQLSLARDEQAAAAHASNQAEQERALVTMAAAAQIARASAEQRLAEQMGDATDWTALLRTLATLTPERVRLVRLDFDVTERGPEARIAGVTAVSGDPAGTQPGESVGMRIRAYADALSLLPIVSDVRMGATSRAVSERGDEWRFEFTISLVPLPATMLQDDARSSAGAGSATASAATGQGEMTR